MKANSLLLLVALLWHSAAPALVAAPLATAFTYQGKLNDGAAPATGSYDFRFILHDAAVGGSQVGDILIAENLPVVSGVFTTTLDFGAAFDGSSRWIEIAVRPGASIVGFTVLSPRQPLTAAPYALHALTPAGPQGIQGLQGNKGDVGTTGASGSQGLKGDTGLTGPQGLAGPTGSPGAAGAAGAKGDPGLIGPAGPAGVKGPQGITGAVGPVGATGPQGPLGLTGATGPTGPVGPAGAKGDKGVNWRGAWNGVTAYAIGDGVAQNGASWLAKAVSSGSAPTVGNPSWDLLADKGGIGAAGPVGASGPQGPAGVAGASGLQGVAGPPGPTGPQGPSGAFSLTGNTASFLGGNVGIGTSSPVSKLHVRSGADDLPSRLQSSGTTGFGAGWDFYQGDVGKGFVGVPDANAAFAPGELMLFGGPDTKVSLWASGARAVTVESTGTVVNGHLSVVGGWLYVYGHAFKSEGGSSWNVISDGRLKQDVRAYEPGLNEVLQLRPVRFRYRDDPERSLTSDHKEVGFIAQEVREVIPEAVAEGKDGYLSLKADPIHWAAINAIQQLNAKIETQHGENTELRREVQELRQLVNLLASKLDARAH